MGKDINKDYLKEQQYKTTKYLEARIKIHSFTENKQSFHQWLFEKYNFSKLINKKIKILDVACGTGVFWKQNAKKMGNIDYELTMTDFANSMLEKSKNNLEGTDIKPNYELAEIEKLEKYKSKFDIVLCHNAVYHAEDKNLGLENLKNCLNNNRDSFVGLTTNSEKHMLNVYEIGRNLDKNFPTDRIIDSFTEEVADTMLPKYFKYEKKIEEEELRVNDWSILMGFVASGVAPRGIKLVDSFYDDYNKIYEAEIEKKKYFSIIKRSPLYICKK